MRSRRVRAQRLLLEPTDWNTRPWRLGVNDGGGFADAA
jgi:hypothetical protein